jgi:hypothetical protein
VVRRKRPHATSPVIEPGDTIVLVAALAALVYDIILTMDEEVELIWTYVSPFFLSANSILIIDTLANACP